LDQFPGIISARTLTDCPADRKFKLLQNDVNARSQTVTLSTVGGITLTVAVAAIPKLVAVIVGYARPWQTFYDAD
jgi:hypothetical protein